jgi:hypothetical protein
VAKTKPQRLVEDRLGELIEPLIPPARHLAARAGD